MKKILTSVMCIAVVAVMTACGGKTNKKAAAGKEETKTEQAAPANSGNAKIDLSQFTRVEVPKSDLVEDWMIPKDGVVTSASKGGGDYTPMVFITVSGITKAQVESYEQVLKDQGMTKSGTTYMNDKVSVGLGTAGVEATKDSEFTITIMQKDK